jgi:pimeloyl-ACP methyl ester carboxylesterase
LQTITVRVEVGGAIGADQPQQVAGTVYLPDDPSDDRRPVIIFASPGGGYTQHYFNMSFPGRTGYSEAEYHTGRGIIFVAMDHLGVGASSTEMMDQLTVEMIADGNDAFVRAVLEQLADGRLAASWPAVADPFVVGIGQSMGGGITMIMQGRKCTFDAIVPLGKSAIHTILPQPTPELSRVVRSIFMFSRQTPLDALSVKIAGDQVPDYIYPFHWEDEPSDIVAADLEGGYPLRQTAPDFGSLTLPRCAVAMSSPGFLTPEVARIDVPVLIAGGERDVMPDVRREPAAFFNSNDIAVFVVPKMAHMHNFANTRHILWQRVADWSLMQARASGDHVCDH